MSRLIPGKTVPDLTIPALGNSHWRLADQQPKHANLVVFYRGVHCPVCKKYLQELNSMHAQFLAIGVVPIAVSGDSEANARIAQDEWELDSLGIAYSQSIESMREWGLYVSSAIKEEEPEQFGEPGLFIVDGDDNLLWAAVQSMPFARPVFADVLAGLKHMLESNYPPRGTT